jgi:ketosteroid isomerase-like protein
VHPVERLLAYEEIRQLASRYALAVDSRNLDALVALFVPDVAVGTDATGRDALRAQFDVSLRAVGRTFLLVGTHVIDLSDADPGLERATGSVYCKGEIQDGARWIHQAILYDDVYERRDETWLFVRRRHRLWYGAEPGVNPLTLGPANWPEHHDGLGTVPEQWASWREFWDADKDGDP